MVTVRGYITPQNAAAEDQIYLESDPMDLTKEFSISYGFIKPETKTINGNTYHQYVELGKTKIHFFDDDGVTIKIKLPDKISDDDANADDSVKLAIGFMVLQKTVACISLEVIKLETLVKLLTMVLSLLRLMQFVVLVK